MTTSIADNIARVEERIAAACQRAGRRRQDVRLVAVSKNVPPDRIRAACEAGLREFGENRVQEAEAKRPPLSDLGVIWHLIGHLQTNKARLARELFQWIQSLDSQRLAQKLDHVAASSSERLPVLLEVKLSDEPTKSGTSVGEVTELARQIGQLPALELRGLMTVPPFFEDRDRARPYFRRVRELARTIDAANLPNVSVGELSMGMSHDFEVAIEEGATMVRVGTAIFGSRA